MLEAKIDRFSSHTLQYVQKCLLSNNCEIRTKDLSFHSRVDNSMSMRQVWKSTHDADWSLLRAGVGRNMLVSDWARLGSE